MQEEIIKFIGEKGLSPWNRTRITIKDKLSVFLKTKDARSVYSKCMSSISKNFVFNDSHNIFHFFEDFSQKSILERQEYFKSFSDFDSSFLKLIREPRPFWSPDYDIVVVTEEDSTFRKLKEMGCNVRFVINDGDVSELQKYDIVQVIDCPNFSIALEKLPQSVFLSTVDEAYMERFVRIVSGWKDNLKIMKTSISDEEISEMVLELDSLSDLYSESLAENLTREKVEEALRNIREEIHSGVKKMSISGESLLEYLNKGNLSKELISLINDAIEKSKIPENIFIKSIPVEIDERELSDFLRRQDIGAFSNKAERIKRESAKLRRVPDVIKRLENYLLLLDFKQGVLKWMKGKKFPQFGERLDIKNSRNEFLENPAPIDFVLGDGKNCSILTGANSGGKTTLLENLIQNVVFSYFGLPVDGDVCLPVFSEVYYFSKNKGGTDKGAFENLLNQLSEIKVGNNVLILADEIESVTEPGVAGKIIASSAEYFVRKGAFIVIATHLGKEIKEYLPEGSRIDGIEAKGLDENNELIVDHNPIMGKLASSTPELIVEKLAKSSDREYFKFLFESMKK